VFTAIRSAEEEPGFVPAASPQVRRRPSLWPPGTAVTSAPEVPAANSRRDAPRPAHIRQVRAGMEVKDLRHRFLTYSFPPRSPGPPHLAVLDTSRLCRGCSRLPRHHPDQAAPSYTALLRQDSGGGLSPPLEQQRLTAQVPFSIACGSFTSCPRSTASVQEPQASARQAEPVSCPIRLEEPLMSPPVRINTGLQAWIWVREDLCRPATKENRERNWRLAQFRSLSGAMSAYSVQVPVLCKRDRVPHPDQDQPNDLLA
jgi:hypothetical protein